MVFRQNDYTPLERVIERHVASGTFNDKKWQEDNKVSVIINTYNQEDQLKKQLRALEEQTYDHGSLEVIVVDDGGKRGSGSSLNYVAETDFSFDVKYVWQEDQGFRLSKARNEALKRATHETVINIDSDMIVNHNYIEDVMRWHYAAKEIGVKVMTVQDRAFVEPEDMHDRLIENRQLDTVKRSVSRRGAGSMEDWRHARYRQTDMLKSIPDSVADPSYVVGSTFSGGNASFSRADAFEVGLYDESFSSWGAEDTEFGIRLYEHFNTKLGEKLFFVPVNTMAYHIEHGDKVSDDDRTQLRKNFWEKVRKFRAKIVDPRPEVSVYIPAFNQEPFLRKAVESISRQTFDLSKLEIVVGEDGSTDKTAQILRDLQREYAGKIKIRIVSDGKNHGMAENTTRTIQAARGKYILQLDPDDEVKPNTIQTLYDVLERNPKASIAFADMIDKDRNGNKKPHWSCPEFTNDWYKARKHKSASQVRDDAVLKMQQGMRIHHPRFFRRDAFFKTEGVNPGLQNAVDYDFCMKLTEVGLPVHRRDKLYIYNWDHGANTTTTKRLLQDANGQVVKETSRLRESQIVRKELYLVDDSNSNRVRTKKVDLRDRRSRLRELYRVWYKVQEQGTPLHRAMISELETVVTNTRWINPTEAREDVKLLLQLQTENKVGNYFNATLQHEDGQYRNALSSLSGIGGSSAQRLEEMIISQMSRRGTA